MRVSDLNKLSNHWQTRECGHADEGKADHNARTRVLSRNESYSVFPQQLARSAAFPSYARQTRES